MQKSLGVVVASAVLLTSVLVSGPGWGSSPAARAGKQQQGSLRETKINSMIEKLHRQIARFNETFDSLFDEDFFENAANPFDEMDEFRDIMRSQFKKLDFGKDMSFSDHLFDTWFSHRFGGNFGDIQKKEDQEYVYYEFKVDDPKKYKFTVKVQGGMIQLSAENKTESKNEKEAYESKSVTEYKFERSFPIPTNVDTSKFKTSVEGNQYIVKFPKRD